MKRKDIKELHQKPTEELNKMLKDARIELSKLKIDQSRNKISNTNLSYEKKKDIARILTILKEKPNETYRSPSSTIRTRLTERLKSGKEGGKVANSK